jgi:hypothetical protein
MRYALIGLWMLLCPAASALAAVSVNIGINLPTYPRLVPVPGYPVYYAPGLPSNYFFYDGLYWIFDGDSWYESSWYNGPWYAVDPLYVPAYVLRVPVRYYRHPPTYFRGWRADAAPRWNDHWGRDWERRHNGWSQSHRGPSPARAPLPTYQRQYAGNRYPPEQQQQPLHAQNYRYQPKDAAVRQHYQQQQGDRGQQEQRREGGRGQQDQQRGEGGRGQGRER